MRNLTRKMARKTAKYTRDHWDPRWKEDIRIKGGFD